MHLTIDIGNTLTKAQWFTTDGPSGELLTGPSESEFILSLLMDPLANRLAIASVVKLDDRLLSIIRERDALLVHSKTPFPILNHYGTPETLGIDRICAAIGARAHFPESPVLAIDMGTCITYELVSGEGAYLGGSISPGMRMRFRALSEHTDKLPLLTPAPMPELIGNDTASCIRSGVQLGILTEIDGMVDHYYELFPGLKTVGTGGDFPFFESAFKRPIFADPILVLRGLHEILLHNS
jgi:type III pantothenate kinase